MATQQSLFKLSGKLGDLVFYQRGEKNLARINAKTYQLTEATIKSANDFGNASRSSAYIRKAFAPLLVSCVRQGLVNRLNAKMVSIFKRIPTDLKGNKSLLHADLASLKGFEFNRYTTLDKLLLQQPSYELSPLGKLTISLPKCDLEKVFVRKNPFKEVAVQLMAFNFDLEGDNYEVFQVNDLKVDLYQPTFSGAKLTIQTFQEGNRGLIVALGARYGGGTADRRYFASQISFAVNLKDGLVIKPLQEAIEVAERKRLVDTGMSWEVE